ncbi:MAG: Lrp/AsnC family transcriptional regulator [Pseudomonadota bacterium]|nr:Lrp/AsnC family transcriptional regulator [Pseudomonadota bacterium]
MKQLKTDKIDNIILSELQRDCRLPVADVAARAGLSPSACHRRMKLLERRGAIAGYGANLNGQALGYSIEFFVEVSLTAQTEQAFERFESAVSRVPEILECHLMSGQFDYLLRIAAADAADYERIHRQRISRLPGIQRIQSSLALRTVKAWSGYPV